MIEISDPLPGSETGYGAVHNIFLDELVACRRPKISMALKVAKGIQPAPKLIEAARSVASASELTVPPMRYRFTPEIVGAGRVGWTSGTHKEVRELARETLDILETLSEEKRRKGHKKGFILEEAVNLAG